MSRLAGVLLWCVAVLGPVDGRARRFVAVEYGVGNVLVDPAGRFAYLPTRAAIDVLDIRAHVLLPQLPVCFVPGPVDAGGTLLPLFDLDDAGVFDLQTGQTRTLVTTGGNFIFADFDAATIANGMLYAASLTFHSVFAVPVDGGVAKAISPSRRAKLCDVVSSPDGSTIAMGDAALNAIHTIRTADNAILATYPVGFPPCRIFFKDAQTVVATNAALSVESDTQGVFAVVDLHDPTVAPRVHPVSSPERLFHAALQPSGRFLALLLVSIGRSGFIDEKKIPHVWIVDVVTGRVRRRIPLQRKGGPGAVAITPDARTLLVGTGRGVEYFRLRRR